MFVKEITFTDYNGEKQVEKHAFNLSKAELTGLEATTPGGLIGYLELITNTKNVPELWELMTRIVKLSYGVKSADGRRFIKNQETLDNFIQTEAYTELIMGFIEDVNSFTEFVNGILPKELAEQIAAEQKKAAAKVVDAN